MAEKVTSYLIHPHGVIEKVDVEIDGGIVWGPENDDHGQIAWLTPSEVFHTEKDSFMLTSIHHLSPIMIPGIERVEANIESLSRVFMEQFQKRLHSAHNVDPLKGRFLFMIAGIIMSTGLVVFLFLTQSRDLLAKIF